MSYPGYPPYNQGFPGQPGMPLPYPQYPSDNVNQQDIPMPNAYPPYQPSYPQQSPYVPQLGQYLPIQPGLANSVPGQYPPQPSSYPVFQPSQAAYPPTPQVSSMYPNMSAKCYESGSQVPPQATYPPLNTLSTPAYDQLLNNSTNQKKKSNPTLRPANPFDPRHDAEILRKAMKGFGTDEKSIIHVLAHRVNSQRQEIYTHFKTMYGKDLLSDLKSELSGRFEDLVKALMTPTVDFLAKEIHNAVKGIGTNEETIIEIICTASNAEIYNIKMAYQRLYGKDLEKVLVGETSGHFRRLLVSLSQGKRCENTFVDIAAAQADANNLLRAGELKLGTDETVFNMILCNRSYCQLQQIFLEYQRLSGKDFDDVIKSEFSGDIKDGLRAIVKSVRDKSAYFATRLYESMAGFGTNDRALIRIVSTRCEIDMVEIKNAYMSMYGKSLESDIAGDTSGDYKKCLLALIVG